MGGTESMPVSRQVGGALSRLRETFLSRRGLRLSLVTLLLVICGTIESIDYSVAGQIQMRHYRCFLNSFVVLVCGICFFFIKMYEDRHTASRGRDTRYWLRKDESPNVTWALKMLCFLFMASLDTMALYLSILSSGNVTTPFRALIQQGAIPVSMFVSWIIMGRKYAMFHAIAATMIILGIAASSWQIFTDQNLMDLSNSSGKTTTSWGLVFFVSTVFMALGGCAKEWAMLHPTHPLRMNTVNFYVALNQFCIGLLISPAGFILQQRSNHYHESSISDLPENFLNGFKCGVLGIGNIQGDYEDTQDDRMMGGCGTAVASTYIYVVVVLCYNMLMLWVIKEGTVVLFFIANAITMPLVALLSASDFYTKLGLIKVSFNAWQIVGFSVVILGTILYRVVEVAPARLVDDDNVGVSPSQLGGCTYGDGFLPDTPIAARQYHLHNSDSCVSFPSVTSDIESDQDAFGIGVPRTATGDRPKDRTPIAFQSLPQDDLNTSRSY